MKAQLLVRTAIECSVELFVKVLACELFVRKQVGSETGFFERTAIECFVELFVGTVIECFVELFVNFVKEWEAEISPEDAQVISCQFSAVNPKKTAKCYSIESSSNPELFDMVEKVTSIELFEWVDRIQLIRCPASSKRGGSTNQQRWASLWGSILIWIL